MVITMMATLFEWNFLVAVGWPEGEAGEVGVGEVPHPEDQKTEFSFLVSCWFVLIFTYYV